MSDLAGLKISLVGPEADVGAYRLRNRNWYSGKFLKGPVDWKWLSAAARLPGRALHVALAIAYLDGFEEAGTVKLKPSVCTELGINRHAAYRALDHLEEAGLIKVQRKKGSAPVVTILFPKAAGAIVSPSGTAFKC
jgi:hypothetical protein